MKIFIRREIKTCFSLRFYKKPVPMIGLLFMMILLSTNNLKSDNFWGIIPSPYCGNVNVIKINRTNDIFASVWGLGMKRSTDNGATWIDINNGLTNQFVRCIEYDSTGNIYIGTFGGGIYKSTNKGDNWTQINQGLTNLNVKTIAIHPTGAIFAGTYGSGIFKSTDGGATWTSSTRRLWFRDVNTISVTPDSSILAGLNGAGIQKSKDMGATWLSANAGLESLNINYFMRYKNEMYAATQGGNVHFSVNNGTSWVVYDSTSIIIDPETNKPLNMTKNVISMVMNSKRELVVATSDIGVARHEEASDKWTLTGFGGIGVNSMAINSAGVIFVAVPSDGIFKSTDFGKTWSSHPGALADGLILRFAGSHNDNIVFVLRDSIVGGATKQLFRSTDNGLNWTQLGLNFQINTFVYDSSGTLYLGTYNGVYKSTDDGINWSASGFSNESINSMIVNKKGDVFATYQERVEPPAVPNTLTFKSTDKGANWSQVYPSNQLGPAWLGCNFNGEIYLSLATDGVYKSTNEGTNWTKISNQQGLSNLAFNSSNHLWAISLQGLKKSTNDGGSWTNYDFSWIPPPSLQKLVITPGSNIFTLPNWTKGAIRTVNNGTKWDTVGSGIIEAQIYTLASGREGRLYLTTNVLYSTVDGPSMVAPTLVSPANYNKAVEVDPTFVWNKAKRADMYEFQIATTRQFESVNIIEKVVLSDTTYPLYYLLNNNTSYYWRVRSKTNSAYSPWSNIYEFRTVLDTVELIAPANNSGGHPITIDFLWHEVKDAIEYTLQVSENQDFSSFVVNKAKIPDTTYNVPGLKLYQKYYWRVKANNGLSESRWSVVWNFRTKLRPPTLRTPANGSYGHLSDVVVTWDASEGASEYYVQIAKDNKFENMIYDGKSSQLLSHNLSLLEYFTKYFWRVYAKDAVGQSDWSEVWSFTTIIESPTLIKPADSTLDSKTQLDFEWNLYDKATMYHIQISDNKNFSKIIFEDSAVTSTTININIFENYKTYYWRVRIKVNQYWGLWSNVWMFSTGLSKPLLKYPANDAANLPLAFYFEWYPVNGAKYYYIQVSKDNAFAEIVKEKSDLTSLSMSITSLEPKSKYYWRVKAFYDNGESPWSDVWSFTTQEDGTSVEYRNSLNAFSIYPNPFFGELIFEIALKTASNVRIELFDAKGVRVSLIHNSYHNFGTAFIKWNNNNLVPGLYICRIFAGDAIIIREVLYIR